MQHDRAGDFYTPLPWVGKAHEYIKKHNMLTGDIQTWDPCAGQGNLLFPPQYTLPHMILSTIQDDDINVLKALSLPEDTQIFQCDFLNTLDYPPEIKHRLLHHKNWLFIMNPPFIVGNDLGASFGSGSVKTGVSDNLIKDEMKELKLHQACQNTSTQFMFRILQIVKEYDLNAIVGTFSNASFLTGMNYANFREVWEEVFGFQGGFCFPSTEFDGLKKKWPVVFTVWKTGAPPGPVRVDVYEGINNMTGKKAFVPAEQPLSKWVDRPSKTIIRPPVSSALTIHAAKGRSDKMAKDAIGHLAWNANNVRDAHLAAILSGPSHSGHGWSITKYNFSQSMVAFAAAKLVKEDWLNNRDEFNVPDNYHDDYEEFYYDSVIYALFHSSNQTVSLGDVAYNGKVYDIRNEFFWIPGDHFATFDIPDDVRSDMWIPRDTFVSKWVHCNYNALSQEAQRVVSAATEIVKVSAPYRLDKNVDMKYQLDRWDAGWYQIHQGLTKVKSAEFVEELNEFYRNYRLLETNMERIHKRLGILP